MRTIKLTQEEFDKLPNYSFSNPTGVVIGKKWKRERNDGWYHCEYESVDDENYAIIRIKKIKIKK